MAPWLPGRVEDGRAKGHASVGWLFSFVSLAWLGMRQQNLVQPGPWGVRPELSHSRRRRLARRSRSSFRQAASIQSLRRRLVGRHAFGRAPELATVFKHGDLRRPRDRVQWRQPKRCLSRIVLFVVLFGVAATNRLVLLPRLSGQGSDPQSVRSLAHTVLVKQYWAGQ